ncbi:MAG: hypothetical protein HY319_23475 [Armatimonadetes bacterium]|nr:hypothetical protein [Armatimonadota bacterium]
MRAIVLLLCFLALPLSAAPAAAEEAVLLRFTVQSNIGGRPVTLSPVITTKNNKQATLQVTSEGAEPLQCTVSARPTVGNGQVRIQMSLALSSGQHRFQKALDFTLPAGQAKQFQFEGASAGEQVNLSVQASLR